MLRMIFGLGILLLSMTVIASDIVSDKNVIPFALDLSSDGKAAEHNKLPILIMFGAEECEYCELLQKEILNPMYISGEYDDKVIIRKVMIDSYDSVRDFTGNNVESSALAQRYNIKVTPTVMLLDSQGNELAPKILGINGVDFYSAYLDQAIEVSYSSLHK
jgi:thioredoxin-related protein